MITACIALGSNLGNRRENLRFAIARIQSLAGTQLTAASDFLCTLPVDSPLGSPEFLNAAVVIETSLSAAALMNALLEIERQLGRRRDDAPRNASRPIDLDLLLFGNSIIRTPDLTVPHPRMHTRLFVLEPLAQVAPNLWHPELNCTIHELLTSLQKDLLRENSPHHS
ncbi:MAG: 2-amino-4-hydroxy-6-hydroxymethyldihydropteridine diphosphokinase [Phycisphaerales bacterium]|nr:2-amino-4-hydroxy-6-hydroxymethyldihydropteridine diphosphokinase [Phycisphaerales bacterium]